MNLTYKILEFLFHKMGLEVIEKLGVLTVLNFYIEQDIEALFGQEPFSDSVMQLKKEANGALPFIYANERYTFFIEENHLILKKNFNEIVFRITINKNCIYNYVLFQEDDKIIQKYQKVNLMQESYFYHKISGSKTQEVNSVTLKASLKELDVDSMQEKFRITYVNEEECKKTPLELFWEKIQKKDIFLVSSLDGIERLNEIFSHLEEKCSKEYARIKLK